MPEVKRVKSASIFPLISEIIQQGQSIRIIVSGDSMYPLLRDGIDSVELTKGSFEGLSCGDIVMIQRTNGQYIMHRVIRKEADCFYMVGDAQQWIEGPLYPNQLVAVVTALWRKDTHISCSNPILRVYSVTWLFLRPYRYFILRVYKKLLKIKNSLFK